MPMAAQEARLPSQAPHRLADANGHQTEGAGRPGCRCGADREGDGIVEDPGVSVRTAG
jgi:hypothetical protein